jgi:hypothetical protein
MKVPIVAKQRGHIESIVPSGLVRCGNNKALPQARFKVRFTLSLSLRISQYRNPLFRHASSEGKKETVQQSPRWRILPEILAN